MLGAQGIVHLLDYVGVDYAGAVEDGKVKSADEFKEMNEFSAQAVERIKTLPANPARSALEADAAKLAGLVAGKAAAKAVAESAASLRWALIRAYGLRVAPRSAPDPARGAALFATDCAACHGAQGRGDGPAAKGLDPVPANFHDTARMAERSVYGLYNAITLGVQGTSMTPFAKLGEDERWALAFYAANLGAKPNAYARARPRGTARRRARPSRSCQCDRLFRKRGPAPGRRAGGARARLAARAPRSDRGRQARADRLRPRQARGEPCPIPGRQPRCGA